MKDLLYILIVAMFLMLSCVTIFSLFVFNIYDLTVAFLVFALLSFYLLQDYLRFKIKKEKMR